MAPVDLPTKIIAGVTVVDTPIVRAAQEYARAHSEDFAFNHVMRSWILGVFIYQKFRQDGVIPEMDLEAHAVSAILHDLGWDCTGEFISEDKRFEVDGAEAARNWIEEEQRSGRVEHWDDHRTQLVWDAIALHTTPSIALHKQAVIKVCASGTFADFLGPKSDKAGTVSSDVFDAVNKVFPRLDLAEGARRMLCGFCRTKPDTTYDNFQMDFGIEFVEGYKPEGKRFLDHLKSALRSSSEQ